MKIRLKQVSYHLIICNMVFSSETVMYEPVGICVTLSYTGQVINDDNKVCNKCPSFISGFYLRDLSGRSLAGLFVVLH